MLFPRLVLLAARSIDLQAFVCRPLLGQRSRFQGGDVPAVAVATGRANGRFELAKSAGLGEKARSALVEQARASTSKTPCEWTVAEKRGFLFWKRPSLLRAHGDLGVNVVEMATGETGIDDLSSDLLLAPEAMRAAAQMLGGGTLIAAVPKRGWLLVGAGAPGEIFKSAPLLDAAGGIASRGGSHAIAGNSVFFVEDGEVIGVESREGSSGGISLARPDETAWS
jgi:hypothetical protein